MLGLVRFTVNIITVTDLGVVDNIRHLLPLVSQADQEHFSTSKRVRHLNQLAKVGEMSLCLLGSIEITYLDSGTPQLTA